jgi:hypothetical protein
LADLKLSAMIVGGALIVGGFAYWLQNQDIIPTDHRRIQLLEERVGLLEVRNRD